MRKEKQKKAAEEAAKKSNSENTSQAIYKQLQGSKQIYISQVRSKLKVSAVALQ